MKPLTILIIRLFPTQNLKFSQNSTTLFIFNYNFFALEHEGYISARLRKFVNIYVTYLYRKEGLRGNISLVN